MDVKARRVTAEASRSAGQLLVAHDRAAFRVVAGGHLLKVQGSTHGVLDVSSLHELNDQRPLCTALLHPHLPGSGKVIVVLLLAGVDTTQSVLNWNLVHLGRNPAALERLSEELFAELGDGPESLFS